MRKTTNYNLTLYDKTDKLSITTSENSLNHNMELIDVALKEKVTKEDVDKAIESAIKTSLEGSY